MSRTMYTVLMILVSGLVTVLIRSLPFILFSGKKKTPEIILYLGKVLPYAVMAMLVVYCLKSVNFVSVGEWAPSLIAGGLVVALYLWKKNSLISIVGGTICYMLLVQFIF